MRIMILVLAAALVGGASGCATLTLSARDRNIVANRNTGKDIKMLQNDWDKLWLVDKPSRTSQYLP